MTILHFISLPTNPPKGQTFSDPPGNKRQSRKLNCEQYWKQTAALRLKQKALRER